MKPTYVLHELGQSLWLDNITRDLLDSGTLKLYIDELSITGLTSNPTIFEQAMRDSTAYDSAIRDGVKAGRTGESLFFDLAIADLARAADLLRSVYDRTNGVDGWVSLEVSPLLAHDTAMTLQAAKSLFARTGRPNLHIKIPGTKEGLLAIEEAIFAGIPVNVTLLFSHEQYLAAADAWLRGVERRMEAGLDPDIRSVGSVFVSRWDTAVASMVPSRLKNKLGIAMAGRIYAAVRTLQASPRWQRVQNAGARPQRLLWASTGVKDPMASDILYVKALTAPFTVNTMPEKTLHAFAEHGDVGPLLSVGGGVAEDVIAQHVSAGIDINAMAAQLQEDGAKSFAKSWNELLSRLDQKCMMFGMTR